MKLQTRFIAQTVAMAFFMATIGFSYSIVTQANPIPSKSVDLFSARAVGSSTLRFLAPAYTPNPAEYDLGDVLYGTTITRYITATGGLRPYSYISQASGLTPTLSGILGANIDVKKSGVVTGFTLANIIPNTAAFAITVTGSTETDIKNTPVPSRTDVFHLTLFPTTANLFRFANDHLNSGVLGQAYLGKADTIGGKGVVTYSIVAGSVTLNGTQIGTGDSLEDSLGLSLSSDGTIYGRPLKTGLVTVQIHAVDAAQRVAKDRNNAIPDQVFAFNIEDAKITSNDSTILAVTVKGDTALVNSDVVRFKAFMNLSGTNTTVLKNQQITVLFGGNTYSGYMDESGNVQTQRGGTLVFPDGTTLKAKVDSVNGTVTGTLMRANVAKGLKAPLIINRSIKRAAFGIIVYNLVAATDTIDFVTKRIGTKYSLTYSIGRTGQPLGGSFQVFDARGSDASDIAGNPGDAWITKFLIAPRFGIDDTAGFDSLTNITVRMGTNFTQVIPVTALKSNSNGSIVLATKGQGASLSKFVINSKAFSGTLTTNPLSQNTTGLSQARDTNFLTNNFFNLAVDVNRIAPNTSFSGEDAKAILKVPVSSKWVDRNTKKPKP